MNQQIESGRRSLLSTATSVVRIQRCGIGSTCDCAPEDRLAGIQRDMDRGATGTGAALPDGVRTRMEQAYSVDFSSVRIHADPPAHKIASTLHARALTAGTDIWFGSGSYRPGTSTGDRLIAHELAHVVQQSRGMTRAALDGGPSDPLEVAAANAADTAVRVRQPADDTARMTTISSQRSAVQRQDVDAGAPTDAGVPIAAASSADAERTGPAWASQINCVIRLGACPGSRPGGIPTNQEITRYNADCPQRDILRRTGHRSV